MEKSKVLMMENPPQKLLDFMSSEKIHFEVKTMFSLTEEEQLKDKKDNEEHPILAISLNKFDMLELKNLCGNHNISPEEFVTDIVQDSLYNGFKTYEGGSNIIFQAGAMHVIHLFMCRIADGMNLMKIEKYFNSLEYEIIEKKSKQLGIQNDN